MKVLIIDNYDSFTYNLYQFVGEILTAEQRQKPAFQFELAVKRNDEVTLEDIRKAGFQRIIVSPGPGSPDDPAYFGVCAEVITKLGAEVPILGVCLGMQGIVHVFGGDVVKAELPMHGKLSPIVHDGAGVFAGIPQGLEIMRYHSLIAKNQTLPSCLEVTAYIQTSEDEEFAAGVPLDAEIMGVRHKEFPIMGIQFHPESFASEGGKEMIANFLTQGGC